MTIMINTIQMGFVRLSCMTILFLSMIFVLSPSSAMDLPVASGGGRRSKAEIGFIFKTWMAEHGKTYTNSNGEKERRFQIFNDNLIYIEQHNAMNHSYQLGLNRFADLTVQEYQDLFSQGYKPSEKALRISRRYEPLKRDHLPKSVDWRTQGAVTAVKNQRECNSCWAFSSVAAIEGINKIVTGDLITLSEQELVDCNMANHGCYGGGFMRKAFDFLVMNNIGLNSQTDYPYIGVPGYCNRNQNNSNKLVTIQGYENVPPNNEAALKKAVAHQPVSVALDKKSQEFRFYISGVFNGPCGTDLDHAVTIVGYGNEYGLDYWIAKNSWGTTWGDFGYIKLVRNIENPSGQCGIAMDASYPTKNSAS